MVLYLVGIDQSNLAACTSTHKQKGAPARGWRNPKVQKPKWLKVFEINLGYHQKSESARISKKCSRWKIIIQSWKNARKFRKYSEWTVRQKFLLRMMFLVEMRTSKKLGWVSILPFLDWVYKHWNFWNQLKLMVWNIWNQLKPTELRSPLHAKFAMSCEAALDQFHQHGPEKCRGCCTVSPFFEVVVFLADVSCACYCIVLYCIVIVNIVHVRPLDVILYCTVHDCTNAIPGREKDTKKEATSNKIKRKKGCKKNTWKKIKEKHKAKKKNTDHHTASYEGHGTWTTVQRGIQEWFQMSIQVHPNAMCKDHQRITFFRAVGQMLKNVVEYIWHCESKKSFKSKDVNKMDEDSAASLMMTTKEYHNISPAPAPSLGWLNGYPPMSQPRNNNWVRSKVFNCEWSRA